MTSSWTTRRDDKRARLAQVSAYVDGKILAPAAIVPALEALLRCGDRVALEGNNQKQADFLSRSLAKVDPASVHDLHLLISTLSRAEHLALFERGIARRRGFLVRRPAEPARRAAAGGRQARDRRDPYLRRAVCAHVRRPDAATWRWCARLQADRAGNLYTGPNTEDTPAIVEATAFRHGIVIAQVNEIVDELPRVDIPGSWIDLVVQATGRSPSSRSSPAIRAIITELQVLMGMMVIRGIYERHGVTRSITASASTPPRSSCCCRPTARRSASREDLPQLGPQSASDADPRDRKRLGRERALLRQRGRHGGLHPRAARHLFHRPRRQPALQPGAVPAGGAVRCRPLHRLDAADGCATPTPPRSRSAGSPASAARRTWATIRKGRRHSTPAWLEPHHGAGPGRARPQARGADWWRRSRRAACRPSSNRWTRSRSDSRPACRSPRS